MLEERRETCTLYLSNAVGCNVCQAINHEERQDSEQAEHEPPQQTGRFFGTEDVQDAKDDGKRYGDWCNGTSKNSAR